MMKKIGTALAAFAVLLAGCGKGGETASLRPDAVYDEKGAAAADGFPGGGQGRPGGEAGVLTAGEWNDLDHWGFWSGLMTGQEYGDASDYWRMYTGRRVAVRLTDGNGHPVPAAKVDLERGGETIWTTRTDKLGEASLWIDPFRKSGPTEGLAVVIDGTRMEGTPKVTPWNVQKDSPEVNDYVVTASAGVSPRADLAFIVDATGSMGDEIDFLKKDLLDILDRVGKRQGGTQLRTGAIFYRDEEDVYLTRHFDFTEDHQKTIQFISQQDAEGGGDLPEAVHAALEAGLKDLTWDMTARARAAFLILDAPAHQDHQGVVESLQASARSYAERGIRLIPVFCSSPSKDCEFMCRFLAILTGGTYVFLTNDSGVGGDHVEASVGEFQAEHLNNLLVRLIERYVG